MADPRPLWEVMAEECAQHPDGIVDLKPGAIAAMIRALRDRELPEDQEPTGHLTDGDCNPQWDRWQQRQRLRALLTAEADRAERGGGETVNSSEADCPTRLRQTHCISNTMSKTNPIQLRKEIHERIELSVYGPDGREQETAASSWELAGVLTAALMRIEDLERRLDADRAERGETINPSKNV